MQDPEFMQIMQDPATQELMPVLMQAQQNPSILQQYENHPTMQRLARVLQRHGMGGGKFLRVILSFRLRHGWRYG